MIYQHYLTLLGSKSIHVLYRDDIERPIRIVSEGGHEAVVHAQLVAAWGWMAEKVSSRLLEFDPQQNLN